MAQIGHRGGLSPWRWIFVVEGLFVSSYHPSFPEAHQQSGHLNITDNLGWDRCHTDTSKRCRIR